VSYDPSFAPDLLGPFITATTEAIEGEDVEELARFMCTVDDLYRMVGDVRSALTEAYVSHAPKLVELPDLPPLEIRRGAVRKKWESQALLTSIIGRAIIDGNGELLGPVEMRDRIESEVSACVPITPSLGWRVTALRERGFDPDEWSESAPGRASVLIHREGMRA
jgi:hypothetical protein